MFQVLGVLALKNARKFLADGGQSRYPSVAVPSCAPRSVRTAAAFSVARVLVAACSLPRLRSFMACMTFSNPICCWLVPATICWKACTLWSMLAAILRIAEAARSADLGYTYGRYTLTPADPAGDPERGHYVRVWTRNRAGQWKLAVDVNVPLPAPAR